MALHDVPPPLVHRELTFSALTHIRVGGGYDPRQRAEHPDVEYLPLFYADVRGVQELLYRSSLVPLVDVKEIYIVDVQLFQGIAD